MPRVLWPPAVVFWPTVRCGEDDGQGGQDGRREAVIDNTIEREGAGPNLVRPARSHRERLAPDAARTPGWTWR